MCLLFFQIGEYHGQPITAKLLMLHFFKVRLAYIRRGTPLLRAQSLVRKLILSTLTLI